MAAAAGADVVAALVTELDAELDAELVEGLALVVVLLA